jgi:hypothetical protein
MSKRDANSLLEELENESESTYVPLRDRKKKIVNFYYFLHLNNLFIFPDLISILNSLRNILVHCLPMLTR